MSDHHRPLDHHGQEERIQAGGRGDNAPPAKRQRMARHAAPAVYNGDGGGDGGEHVDAAHGDVTNGDRGAAAVGDNSADAAAAEEAGAEEAGAGGRDVMVEEGSEADAPTLTALEQKISHFLQLKRQGMHLNDNLRQQRQFHNPEILGKIVEGIGIDMYGTNYPAHMYDSSAEGMHLREDRYDVLRRQQQKVATVVAGSGGDPRVQRAFGTKQTASSMQKQQKHQTQQHRGGGSGGGGGAGTEADKERERERRKREKKRKYGGGAYHRQRYRERR